MTQYETLAWNIPPSYDMSLEQVDLPPKERDGAVVLDHSQTIE